MQISNLINKINFKKSNFNRDKPIFLKRSKHQREERYDIACVTTRVKYQVLYVRATSIPNFKLNVIINDEIIVGYDYVIKIT